MYGRLKAHYDKIEEKIHTDILDFRTLQRERQGIEGYS
ncbi:hypothetical protein E6C60_2867 [Paenibacillus algicola]|uniref:Uncharacterized protein n=1 Tax=Paenibacillus algicola TaxID=2565926 RepID=A0A4P8XM28_9BACL|nr:hypothetical protein E6C60_2867 [Paenibacillus algicola]